jgi:hypothetical protein
MINSSDIKFMPPLKINKGKSVLLTSANILLWLSSMGEDPMREIQLGRMGSIDGGRGRGERTDRWGERGRWT